MDEQRWPTVAQGWRAWRARWRRPSGRRGHEHAPAEGAGGRARAASRRSTWGVVRTLLLVALVSAAGLSPWTDTAPTHGAPAARPALFPDLRVQVQADDLTARAEALLRQGDAAGALSLYDQALAAHRQRGNRPGELYILISMGAAYINLSQDARAVEVLQAAVTLAQQLGDRQNEGVAAKNLGAAYFNLGEYARAEEFTQRALALGQDGGTQAADATALVNLAVAARAQGRVAEAGELYQQAVARARATGDRAAEGLALGNLAALAFVQRDYPQALALSQEAVVLTRELGDRAGEALVLANLGSIYTTLGDLPAALDAYRQAIEAREDVRTAARLEEFRTSLAAEAVDIYQRAVALHLRVGQAADAFDLAERSRARTFLDQLGSAQLELTRAAEPTLVRREQELRSEIGRLDEQVRRARSEPTAQRDGERLATSTAELAVRQREYQDLLIQLKLRDPEASALVSVEPLSLSEVQRLLDADTTLLSYYVTPDRTTAFVVRRDGFQAVDLPIGEQALRDAIADFRRFADPADTSPASLRQLATWLIAPVAEHLTTPVVGIVPHGVLHYLPFAGLPDGAGYFGDRYQLFHLPSASTLPFIQAKRKADGDRLLALAQSRVAGLPPLRYADVEVEAIARLYNTQPLVDTAATKSAFLARASDANILHLAAHGELNPSNPLFSRILLAPDGPVDGSLTVQDVYRLNLANADLVTLSACETQLGVRSQGDDVIGLNRAFIYAGTPTVIASLWSVNDHTTALLMTALYRYLREGRSKAEALQAAQAETRAQYPHPYYWAGFVLTGDPGTRTGSPRPAPAATPR